MIHPDEQHKLIAEAIETLPTTFGLRAYPGHKFRVDARDSYVQDDGRVQLYVHIQSPDEKWRGFAKGTPDELRKEIV